MQTKQCTLRAIATRVVYLAIFRFGTYLNLFKLLTDGPHGFL